MVTGPAAPAELFRNANSMPYLISTELETRGVVLSSLSFNKFPSDVDEHWNLKTCGLGQWLSVALDIKNEKQPDIIFLWKEVHIANIWRIFLPHQKQNENWAWVIWSSSCNFCIMENREEHVKQQYQNAIYEIHTEGNSPGQIT